jgi:hypothetical protein
MADLVLVAADTLSSGKQQSGIAGVTVVAADILYADATDGEKLKLADSTIAAEEAKALGMALNGGAVGQPIDYIKSGIVTVTAAAVTIGEVYALSAAGKLAPVADLLSTEFVTVVAIGVAANQLLVAIVVGGVAKP